MTEQELTISNRFAGWMVAFFQRHGWLARGDSQATPKGGRSSLEDTGDLLNRINTFNSKFDGLAPVVPTKVLEFLELSGLNNPDMNVATNNVKALANNGHEVIITTENDALADAAQFELNDRAANIYSRSAGVDGLIGHYIDQLAYTGAISSEDVVTPRVDGVEKVVTVPTHQIRFVWDGKEYRPHQRVNLVTRDNLELNPLNENTYCYYAFRTFRNSPYAIPMYISAVDPLLQQEDAAKNIKFILKKFGLLGLVTYTLNKIVKQPTETEGEYNARVEKQMTETAKTLEKNFLQGLMVKPSGHVVEHNNITGDARGIESVWNMMEHMMSNALLVDPLFLGYNFNTTETFGNVVYRFIVGHAEQLRRLIKRRMERTYGLHLRLRGIFVDDLAFTFNSQPARDPLAQEESEWMKHQRITDGVLKGMIEPDVAAQELGYSEWFDKSRLSSAFGDAPIVLNRMQKRLRFRFNSALNRYEFLRPALRLRSGSEDVTSTPLSDREHEQSRNVLAISKDKADELLRNFSNRYRNTVEDWLNVSIDEAMRVLRGWMERSDFTDFGNEKDFAREAFAILGESLVDAPGSRQAESAVRDAINEAYDYFRLDDRGIFSKNPETSFALDAVDRRSKRFMERVDRFFFGKYIYNEPTENSVKKFLEEEFIEKGESLFGRTNRQTLDEFIGLATDRMERLQDFEAQRIINTSVQRMRTWGNVGQLAQAGFEYAEVFNPSPDAEICKFMAGKLIPVGTARNAIEELSQLDPQQFRDRLTTITPASISAEGIESATAGGRGFPPYHPNCKTQLIATTRTLQSRKLLSREDVKKLVTLHKNGNHRNGDLSYLKVPGVI